MVAVIVSPVFVPAMSRPRAPTAVSPNAAAPDTPPANPERAPASAPCTPPHRRRDDATEALDREASVLMAQLWSGISPISLALAATD